MVDPRTRELQQETVRHERANQKSKKAGRSTKALLGASTTGPAALPFEVLEAQDLDNDSPMDSDAGPVENLDKYGVRLPKKQQPKNGNVPNNRFIVERHFSYDEYEIGNRNVKTKRTNTGEAVYMGKEGNPNPKSFYFDQRANGFNSARNKPDDLDGQQVEIFGLHPIYGLPINGCKNMNYEEYAKEFGEEMAAQQDVLKPRTDWSQPLPPTQPKIFIEEERDFDPLRVRDDRFKRIFRTSRSEHHMRLEQVFRERPGKEKIETMLQELWPDFLEARRGAMDALPELISPSPSPVSDTAHFRAIEEEHASLATFLAAANKLETDEQARIARSRVTETARPRRAFDPVRDISPPPPPPEDRTNLNVLASVVLGNNARMAPPPPPPPPPSLQQQQQQQQPMQTLPPTMQTQHHPFARSWAAQFPWARARTGTDRNIASPAIGGGAGDPTSQHQHQPFSHGLNPQPQRQGMQQQTMPHLQHLQPQSLPPPQQQPRGQGGSGSLRQLLPAPSQIGSAGQGQSRYGY